MSEQENRLSRIIVENNQTYYLRNEFLFPENEIISNFENHRNRDIHPNEIRILPTINPQERVIFSRSNQILPNDNTIVELIRQRDPLQDVDVSSNDTPFLGFGLNRVSFDNGLAVSRHTNSGNLSYPTVPEGAVVGRMDFVPSLGADDSPEDLHNIILGGLTDLQEYFKKIDHGLEKPEYLVGRTNRRMAMATRRLGFKVHAPKSEGYFTVVGETDKVRAKLEERDAKGRTILEKVRHRKPQLKLVK